jgi:trehalose synthase
VTTDDRGDLMEATIDPMPLDRFEKLLSADAYAEFKDAMSRGAEALGDRTMWHVNATLEGGGVAEMLGSLLPYICESGITARWAAINGDDDFFTVTKRLHNYLHGSEGDGGDLGEIEKKIYTSSLAGDESKLAPQIQPGDIVFVHDPQTAGLIPALAERGAAVIWHCHIGADEPNDKVRHAWDFLRDYVAAADRYIFSRTAYLWEGLDEDKLRVIPPSIDAFSPKNQPLDPQTVEAILRVSDVLPGDPESPPTFTRADGTTGTVSRKVSIIDDGNPPPDDARIVLQSARWDRLKDPSGVIEFFADHIAEAESDVHLIVAGPSTEGVSDDPEDKEVVEECRTLRKSLSPEIRERVHLMSSPMDDDDEAGVLVNALQRRGDVVVQKSLAEGFGLVIAEAMWKERPVVSARVGGIQDQIEHGKNGLLVDDPSDGLGFARAVTDLLDDPGRAKEMGARARDRVVDRFLAPRQLTQTMEMVDDLV